MAGEMKHRKFGGGNGIIVEDPISLRRCLPLTLGGQRLRLLKLRTPRGYVVPSGNEVRDEIMEAKCWSNLSIDRTGISRFKLLFQRTHQTHQR